MTQLVNNTTIANGSTVTCNTTVAGAQYHVQNSFWRAFNPSAMGITTPIDVTCITYGVEFCTAGVASVPAFQQPLQIRLRKAINTLASTFPGATPAVTHTEIFSQANVAANAANKVFTRGMSTVVTLNPNDLLVVELYLPDGVAGQNVLFPGSNSLGQTAPGYISAPGCGIAAPTPFAGIGFPNVHILLDVNYVVTGGLLVPSASTITIPSSANPGFTDLTLINTNLIPGHEIWNIYSWQPCPGGVGSGPFLGLCFVTLGDVLPQLSTPLGFAPFHFLADNCTMSFGPFPIPSGITLELVTVDYNSLTATLNGVSTAIQIVL